LKFKKEISEEVEKSLITSLPAGRQGLEVRDLKNISLDIEKG
jgi:hypothetical protein